MRFILSIVLVFSFTITGALFISSCSKEKSVSAAALETEQTTCPVLGNPIDKSVYYDYKGKRIYFCCKGCIDEFKKDPEKYMKKLKGLKLPDVPKT